MKTAAHPSTKVVPRRPKAEGCASGSRSGKRRGRGLNPLQADYVLGLLYGKSKRRAALDAGYAEETARNAAQNVEGKRRGSFSVMRLIVQAMEHSRSELSGTEENGTFRHGD